MHASEKRLSFLPGTARLLAVLSCGVAGVVFTGCGDGATSWKCQIIDSAMAAPDSLEKVGCTADFLALASAPLNATIPGARSGKVVFDTFDDTLYFQNSGKYKIHYEFVSKHLSGPQRPIVAALSEFNRTEYYRDDRRFILGAVTHYEGPNIWAVEVAPYDTASPKKIETLFAAVKRASFFGPALVFHPTSEAIETVAKQLPASVPIKTSDDIFATVEYQPLNLATTVGRLRFVNAAQLGTTYLAFRDVVVLDHVPNDISVVSGMITQEFQTPLSHVNVLAQNRKAPNMGLRHATTNPKLRALDGKWVQLVVGAFEWTIREATQAEADAWWEAHRPVPVQIPDMDLTQIALKNIEDLVDEGDATAGAGAVNLRQAIQKAILAYGGKASNYSILAKTPGVPVRKAFGIPVFYYAQFMEQNGFFTRVDGLLADPQFANDPQIRDAKLKELREAILVGAVDPVFQGLLRAKLEQDFPGLTMRFRTSTNAEDQEGFLCAGCYDSHTGDPNDWSVDTADCHTDGTKSCGILQAIRKTWATVWQFRTFEERSYHGIDHKKIGMALLVHHNFAAEEANGVAVSANPFDSSGLEPGFYVNAQWGGDIEVVAPPPGVTSDQFLYFYYYDDKPITYLGHSNLVRPGETVLSAPQILELGTALDAIQKRFSPAYGPLSGFTGWYGLEVDFKFDDEDNATPGLPPRLLIKQARPYRGRGQ